MDPRLFINAFSDVISSGLPGEKSHGEAMPVNRKFTSDSLKIAPDVRNSAVGIILYPKASSFQSILIQRPDYNGTHGNQISFPGGKMDQEDPNLEYTARRECMEEIALPMNSGKMIGELSSVHIPVSKFLVKPFVFFVDELPQLHPDEREVASIIHFDVFDLINEANLKTTDIKFRQGFVQKNVPYYDIKGHVVWGATAMMLAELKAILKQL